MDGSPAPGVQCAQRCPFHRMDRGAPHPQLGDRVGQVLGVAGRGLVPGHPVGGVPAPHLCWARGRVLGHRVVGIIGDVGVRGHTMLHRVGMVGAEPQTLAAAWFVPTPACPLGSSRCAWPGGARLAGQRYYGGKGQQRLPTPRSARRSAHVRTPGGTRERQARRPGWLRWSWTSTRSGRRWRLRTGRTASGPTRDHRPARRGSTAPGAAPHGRRLLRPVQVPDR